MAMEMAARRTSHLRLLTGAVLPVVATLGRTDVRAEVRTDALPTLLARAGAYVQQFEQDFSTVISDESYEQHAERTRSEGKRRQVLASADRILESEMFFAWLPVEREWLTVRNVLAVDSHEVPDSRYRIDRAFADESTRLSRLRQLADEGARFNIGAIVRNINDPAFAIRFLDPALQSRFAFSAGRADTIAGHRAVKLSFVERERPSITRLPNGRSVPSRGAFWIADTGEVVRSELSYRESTTKLDATIGVDFERQPSLELWVPSRMTEEYVKSLEAAEERITCTATYTNFRRFTTSARIVSQTVDPMAADTWAFMRGEWVGEGTSELGRGAGYFSFEPDLGGKVWVRRNHAEYPSQNGGPAAVHEDLMVVYFDPASKETRAFYTDTEGHTIPYAVTFAADRKTVTFVSAAQPKEPRYRLTYVLLEPGRMSVTLETAPPDTPDAFMKIVEGRVRRR